MKTWWEGLATRERWMVMLAISVAVVATLYLAMWEPFYNHLKMLRQTVVEERGQLAWMGQATVELAALRGPSPSKDTKKSTESPLALVDRSIRTAGLGKELKRVEPEGKNKVRFWLDDITFDSLIPWLQEINKHQGMFAESLVVEHQSIPGKVNVRGVMSGTSE